MRTVNWKPVVRVAHLQMEYKHARKCGNLDRHVCLTAAAFALALDRLIAKIQPKQVWNRVSFRPFGGTGLVCVRAHHWGLWMFVVDEVECERDKILFCGRNSGA